jgi:hypothetical protein
MGETTMITITAKIDLLSGDNEALSLSSDNLSKNNISSDLSAIKGVKKQGGNPFIIGSSKIGDGSVLSSGVDYFIGNELSNEQGEFLQDYILTVSSTQQLNSITISFDTENNRHPKTIEIDGTTYYDDDAIFTVANLGGGNTHTIKIRNWSVKKAPIVITGVYVEVSIEINNRNLIEISGSIFDRSDLKLPSWGIISNVGEIQFNDLDGEIRDYAEQLLLSSGLKCEIKLNNTLVGGASETIGIYETDQWDYDNDNRIVSVSLKDDLEKLQNYNISEIYYDGTQEKKQLKWWYNQLYDKTKARGFLILEFSQLDDKTKDILENTYIKSPYLKGTNFWSAWSKLCEASLSYMYKYNDIIIFRHTGGS